MIIFFSTLNSLVTVSLFRAVILIIVAVSASNAQGFNFGVKGGLPLFAQFDEESTGNPAFHSSPRRWLVGPTAEFRVHRDLSVEVDALFKRVGFDYNDLSEDGTNVHSATTATQWEFPLLFKYRFTERRVRPFVDFGASLRHMSSLTQRTNTIVDNTPELIDNSNVLRNRNSYGGVFGVGGSVKIGRMYVSPEVRYTRWANEAFGVTVRQRFRNRLDQLDFIVGLTF